MDKFTFMTVQFTKSQWRQYPWYKKLHWIIFMNLIPDSRLVITDDFSSDVIKPEGIKE